MEVHNTFTSLIADLPYPAKKQQTTTQKPIEQSSTLDKPHSIQSNERPEPPKSHPTSVNILV